VAQRHQVSLFCTQRRSIYNATAYNEPDQVTADHVRRPSGRRRNPQFPATIIVYHLIASDDRNFLAESAAEHLDQNL
jgi:hypothetical protein